jgi:hypothetical protein|tara:strand:+ start:2100 stop:2822 length:723 start_codon:yes stop_codon:yes gene_type:complete
MNGSSERLNSQYCDVSDDTGKTVICASTVDSIIPFTADYHVCPRARRKELPVMKLNKKLAQAVIAIVVVVTTGTTVSADWNHFWHNVHVGYHRNNAWPAPFNEADAMNVVAPFEIMKANGWRMHNTIGHELFRSDDGALMASGNKRVYWIATQAPVSRRTVFVLRGVSESETAARVKAVQDTINRLALTGPVPQVQVTNVEPHHSSGAWATKINREWLQNLASPRLPSSSAGGTAGVTNQ